MSNLSQLPHDVLVEIAKRLKQLEDYVCFRCVSKSLLAAVKDEYFEGLRCRKQTPYLMLPVRDDGDDDVRELYSLVDGESIVASIKVPKFKNKKCFESLGWLLAVEEDGNMSLLDPFSDTEIPLPHQNTFPGYHSDYMYTHEMIFIWKMVLSSRPSENSDFILMVIAGGRGHLCFWRLGDKVWTKIKERKGCYSDVVYHGSGQFYAVGYPGVVWVFDLSGSDNRVKSRLILSCDHVVPDPKSIDDNPRHPSMNLYILETNDRLLIITRRSRNLSPDGLHFMTSKIKVYEVDIVKSKCKEIYSLGSMAVIVGHNSTIVVDASRSPGGVIKPNRIYFTDDDSEYYYLHSKAKGGGMDMGVYNLETGTVEPIYPGEPLLSKVSTSMWITPYYSC